MPSVLIVQYSQSGQLTSVVRNFIGPLLEANDIDVTIETLKPRKPYPFPWPVLGFLDAFPECVYEDGPELEPLSVPLDKQFDLVILAYQVWFLSPSLPVTSFLASPEAKKLLGGRKVITLIACRNMWLMAQERVKERLSLLGASLVGNVALTDEAGSAGSFLATPLWVLSGNKGPFLGGIIPRAGVSTADISGSRRFGVRILEKLRSGSDIDEGLLKGLGAVRINEGLIASERTARRSFLIWGALLRKVGRSGSVLRKPILLVYMVFLVTLIITFIPISVLIKKLLSPFTKRGIAAQKQYYASPSGE